MNSSTNPQFLKLLILHKIIAMKLISLLFVLFISTNLSAQEKTKAEQLAQQQLDAYNNRDIDAFLLPYSDTVTVYMYPDQLMYKGKETMRQQYAGMFKNTPDLFCKLQNRIVLANTVIDHELVTFNKAQPAMQAIAVYTVDKDKIVAVRFIVPQ